MKKIYLINNQPNSDNSLLKKLFPKALLSAGLGLVDEVDLDTEIKIDGDTKKRPDELHYVVINGLDENESIREVLKINLEKDIEGISTKHKTPEVALLILQEFDNSFKLNVILIELKSTLDNKKVKDCEDKFRCAINRMYMLLHFFDYERYGRAKNIYIEFKGIVMYNNIMTDINDESGLGKIFLNYQSNMINQKRDSTLSLVSIISDNEKVAVKFFANPDQEKQKNSFHISLKDLLS
ncbi:MAG: hypothetical protein MUE85_04715 [Microscillaceae bacterium]|jgi:hypothetical protein|nr:hypothetical protein [Microscillaceae bacterium]